MDAFQRNNSSLCSHVFNRLHNGKIRGKKLYLRGSNFYNQFRIKTLFKNPVNGIDDRNKRVILQSGREFNFDRLLIATGAVPIKPSIKGIDMEHVFFLNKLNDAKQIARK
jgi:NAD(P)H-nitrite reductase large subunit